MGKPVTLDSDDVEILLNAAAAIRHVENALEAVRNDPAMQRIYKSGKIGQALDRCNRARAQAIREYRAEPPPGWSPSRNEVELLKLLHLAGPHGRRVANVTEYAQLRAYGLCVAGQENTVVTWGDKTETAESSPAQRMRLTEMGESFFDLDPARTQPKEITHD